MIDDPKSGKPYGSYVRPAMLVLVIVGTIYAIYRRNWADFIGVLPFCFFLLPTYSIVEKWAQGHKYPLTMFFMILNLVPLLAIFLVKLYTDNCWIALTTTAPFALFFGMLGVGIFFTFDKNRRV